MSSAEAARAVVKFWKKAGPKRWFAKSDAFDRSFKNQFLALHEAAARHQHDAWVMTYDGALALMILLDQFPRNAFRGTARMFATDKQALAIADMAIGLGHHRSVTPELALFFYLPYQHAENLSAQQRSLELHAHLPDQLKRYARIHHDVIARFGRFPHRNAVLGRTTTPEEQAFLDAGGFSG